MNCRNGVGNSRFRLNHADTDAQERFLNRVRWFDSGRGHRFVKSLQSRNFARGTDLNVVEPYEASVEGTMGHALGAIVPAVVAGCAPP
jgi:hypothetical protein